MGNNQVWAASMDTIYIIDIEKKQGKVKSNSVTKRKLSKSVHSNSSVRVVFERSLYISLIWTVNVAVKGLSSFAEDDMRS